MKRLYRLRSSGSGGGGCSGGGSSNIFYASRNQCSRQGVHLLHEGSNAAMPSKPTWSQTQKAFMPARAPFSCASLACLPVRLDCAFSNSCFDWRSCQSRRAAVLQPSGGNGRLKLAATSRIPALQYKSVPKSFLCVKHKLCFPWSPNAGGHKKYLVNGAKKMSGDLNMFFYSRCPPHQ